MAYSLKQYAGFAQPTTLAVAIGPSDATIQATNATNYPDGSVGPFTIDLNLGGPTEEKVLCSARSGNVFTVAVSGRGYDGTTATSHNMTETFNHVVTAVDMTEANYAVTQTVGKVTSLGDLLVGTGAAALKRLGVGSTGQVATVSGGDVVWATPATSPTSLITALGDLLVGLSSGVLKKLGIGSSGQVLTVSGGDVIWATPAAQSIPHANYVNTGGIETTTSTSFTNLATAGPALTVNVTSTGVVMVEIDSVMQGSNSTANPSMGVALSGANTVTPGNNNFLIQETGTFGCEFGKCFVLTGLSPGSTTFTAKYAELSGTGTAEFAARGLIVWAF